MNKSIPKGYTDKKSEDIRTEWNKAVISLGQERANELRSQRNQLQIEEHIETLEAQFTAASQYEAKKAAQLSAKTEPAQTVATEASTEATDGTPEPTDTVNTEQSA